MILHEINTFAIHFQVKVPTADVWSGSKKEFHTTVFPYPPVRFFGNGPDIIIFYSENDVNIIIVIL
jgi:hypothetical protein